MQNEDPPGSTLPSGSNASPRDEIASEFAATQHGAGGAPVYEDGKPIIRWRDGDLHGVVDEAEAALMLPDADHLFQRGPFVVRVVRQPSLSVRNFKRAAGSLGIVMVDKPYLVESMTRAAHWEKFDGRSQTYKRVNAPDLAAQTYLSRRGHWKLRRLVSTISAPTLRPDGSLLQKPGYDEATMSWYDPGASEFPSVPEKPTQKQAMAALEIFAGVLDTVPFEDLDIDKAVALALMLTALARRSLPSAPLGAITAPTPGSGKTLLADCIAILATGVPAPAMSYPSSDEEAEKLALSILMAGDPVVLVDNVERPLKGAWLCSILTSESWQGRMLGRNEMINVPTNVLWLATGNKLVIEGDLRTRALLCRIDPKSERPDQREFAEDLKEVFSRRRVELVAAGLTIMRAYLHGGERSSLGRPWGRYEAWSKFCREPLMWLGMADPCESYALIAADDPEGQEHRQLLEVWREIFPNEPATARAAITQAATREDLRELLHEVARDRAGGLSAKRLGRWLLGKEGRIANIAKDGLSQPVKFERDGEDHGAILWKVIDAPPKSAGLRV